MKGSTLGSQEPFCPDKERGFTAFMKCVRLSVQEYEVSELHWKREVRTSLKFADTCAN